MLLNGMEDCAWDDLDPAVFWDAQTKTWDDYGQWYMWGADMPISDGWIPDIPLTEGWIPDVPPVNTWTSEGPVKPC